MADGGGGVSDRYERRGCALIHHTTLFMEGQRRFVEGLWKVRGRFVEGLWKVCGKFLEDSGKVHGRFTEGSQKVHGRFAEGSC